MQGKCRPASSHPKSVACVLCLCLFRRDGAKSSAGILAPVLAKGLDSASFALNPGIRDAITRPVGPRIGRGTTAWPALANEAGCGRLSQGMAQEPIVLLLVFGHASGARHVEMTKWRRKTHKSHGMHGLKEDAKARSQGGHWVKGKKGKNEDKGSEEADNEKRITIEKQGRVWAGHGLEAGSVAGPI